MPSRFSLAFGLPVCVKTGILRDNDVGTKFAFNLASAYIVTKLLFTVMYDLHCVIM